VQSARALKQQGWVIGLPSEKDFFDKVLQPTPEAVGFADYHGPERNAGDRDHGGKDRDEPKEQYDGGQE
jgi:hypothetical protein